MAVEEVRRSPAEEGQRRSFVVEGSQIDYPDDRNSAERGNSAVEGPRMEAAAARRRSNPGWT
jgi:hypothetical protein